MPRFRPRPQALIVTCSDGTLDATPIRRWEREPILMYRTAGNEVPDRDRADDDWLAVLDAAVNGYGVRDVIVCGHSGCRHMRAERASRRTDRLARCGVDGRGGMAKFRRRMAEAAAVTELAKSRALRQLDALRTYPVIEDRLAEGALRLSAMVYLHESDVLLCYDELIDEFRALGL
jgi:carbonic anhydrase